MTEDSPHDGDAQFMAWFEAENQRREIAHLESLRGRYEWLIVLCCLLTAAWGVGLYVGYQVGRVPPDIAGVVTAAVMSGGGSTTNLNSFASTPRSRIILLRKKFSLLNGLGMAMVLPRRSRKSFAGFSLRTTSCEPSRWPRQAILMGAPCSRIFMARGTVKKPASSFLLFKASTIVGNSLKRMASKRVPVVLVLEA